MKEFIENLISRLEERIKYNELCHKEFPNAKMSLTYEVQINAYKNSIAIVNQLAEEYNNDGWIPCSERLPDKEGEYLVTLRRWNCVTFANFKDIKNNPHFDTNYVTAWQPLPEPYQPKGE